MGANGHFTGHVPALSAAIASRRCTITSNSTTTSSMSTRQKQLGMAGKKVVCFGICNRNGPLGKRFYIWSGLFATSGAILPGHRASWGLANGWKELCRKGFQFFPRFEVFANGREGHDMATDREKVLAEQSMNMYISGWHVSGMTPGQPLIGSGRTLDHEQTTGRLGPRFRFVLAD